MILEVDLEHPKELHELHNDYPLAVEKMKVTKEMLSPYCKDIQEQFGISIGQVAKLIPICSHKIRVLGVRVRESPARYNVWVANS